MSGVEVAGARAVVTGAGSGIGHATARLFAQRGAAVVCVDIDLASARATAGECGSTASARGCDVSDSGAVQALAQAIETEDGPVDILVNNAGVGIGGPFLEATVEDWDWLVGINLDGVAYGCHAFGAAMVQRGRGHVVNVASAAAYLMSGQMAAYCASKAAVVALSRCLRADWAPAGVGVSAICPGVINTPIARHTRMYGELAGKQEQMARAFRVGHSPDLVAKAIASAVRRNRELVPVGVESGLAYRIAPLVPGRVKTLLGRAPLHRLAR